MKAATDFTSLSYFYNIIINPTKNLDSKGKNKIQLYNIFRHIKVSILPPPVKKYVL
jgi:hypothetical protein